MNVSSLGREGGGGDAARAPLFARANVDVPATPAFPGVENEGGEGVCDGGRAVAVRPVVRALVWDRGCRDMRGFAGVLVLLSVEKDTSNGGSEWGDGGEGGGLGLKCGLGGVRVLGCLEVAVGREDGEGEGDGETRRGVRERRERDDTVVVVFGRDVEFESVPVREYACGGGPVLEPALERDWA